MKTYSDFLIEYDAKQLAGANPKLAAVAQRRQRQRELAGGKGSEGSAAPLTPAMRGQQEKQRRIKQGNNKGLQAPKAIEKRPTSRAVDKPGTLAKGSSQLAKTPADKGSAIVRQKQGAPSRDAVGKRAPAQKGYMTSPDGVNSSRIPKPEGPSIGKRYSNMKKGLKNKADKMGANSELAKDAKKVGKAVLNVAKRVGKPQKSGADQKATGKISAGPTVSKYQA